MQNSFLGSSLAVEAAPMGGSSGGWVVVVVGGTVVVGAGGPTGPTGPGSPIPPSGPGAPRAPWGPVSPESPFSPFSPLSPLGPTGPVLPMSPGGPAGPVMPLGPMAPATPGVPASAGGGAGRRSSSIFPSRNWSHLRALIFSRRVSRYLAASSFCMRCTSFCSGVALLPKDLGAVSRTSRSMLRSRRTPIWSQLASEPSRDRSFSWVVKR